MKRKLHSFSNSMGAEGLPVPGERCVAFLVSRTAPELGGLWKQGSRGGLMTRSLGLTGAV